MDNPGLHNLTRRLERLERELRWWRLGALGAVVLLVALGAAPRGTTLEAERLVIRDAKGTVRAVLGSETEERGWSRLPSLPWASVSFPWLPVPKAKFGLYLYTEQGAEPSHINLSPDGNPNLLLMDPQQRAFAAIFTDGGSALLNFAANVKTREEVAAALQQHELHEMTPSPEAEGVLQMAANPSVKHGLMPPAYLLSGWANSVGGFDFTPGSLVLYDKDVRERAVLGRTGVETIKTGTVEQRAESSLILFDKDGKVLWQAP